MIYRLHPDAETELTEAAVYYNAHASSAVAQAFLGEFERVVGLLAANPQRAPHTESGLRVFHFNRFPYSVVYEDNASAGLQIFAVAHQHRAPGYWTKRL